MRRARSVCGCFFTPVLAMQTHRKASHTLAVVRDSRRDDEQLIDTSIDQRERSGGFRNLKSDEKQSDASGIRWSWRVGFLTDILIGKREKIKTAGDHFGLSYSNNYHFNCDCFSFPHSDALQFCVIEWLIRKFFPNNSEAWRMFFSDVRQKINIQQDWLTLHGNVLIFFLFPKSSV